MNFDSSHARVRVGGFLGILLVVLACAKPVVYHGRRVGGGLIFWSLKSERAMGFQFIQELEAEGLPYVRHPIVMAQLKRITDRLIAAVPPAFPRYSFDFAVIDDCVVNAFALPGGPIRIHRGLLRQMETEAELAGVLAHEMGHVLGRHGTKRLSDIYLKLGLLGAVVTVADAIESDKCQRVDEGECKKTWTTVVGVVGYMGVVLSTLRYSRDNEREADWIGAHLMADAGYDPEGLARTFEKFYEIKKTQGVSETGFLWKILSTHPPDLERARRVREIRAQRLQDHPTDLLMTTPMFDRLRQTLRRLPPAVEQDAIMALQCRVVNRECDARREQCYTRLLTCEGETCKVIRSQCRHIEAECRRTQRQCLAYRERVRREPPQC